MVTIGIVGAGFAGLRAYNVLRRRLPEAKLLLFDKSSQFTYIPSLHIALVKPQYLKKIQFSLAKYYEGFINEEVKQVKSGMVITTNGSYACDYIILATGAATNFFGNKQMETYTHSAKTPADIIKLWPLIDKAKHIAVIGGGLTGVEYAAMLAQKYRRKNKSVTLVSGTPRLLPALHRRNHDIALRHLHRHGVHVELGRFATAADAKSITLDDGQKLKTDCVLMCAGIRQETDLCRVSTVNKQRQVEPMAEGIFVAGDVCRTDVAPTAHNAMIEGDAVACHIINLIKHGRLHERHPQNWEVLAVALGSSFGTFTNGKRTWVVPFTGLVKWCIERRVIFEFKHHLLLPI